MPHYHPPRSLKEQPFSLVVAEPLPDLPALEAFLRAFPREPGIRQVIAPIPVPSLPEGPEPTEVAWEAGQGEGAWLSMALEKVQNERVLVLGGPVERYPAADSLSRMADKLDLAHLVLAPRPQRPWSPPARGAHKLWSGMVRWVLALEAKPEPCWPGWGAWIRRFGARWVLAVPGNDPGTPHRMLRREMISSLNLQSTSEFVWVEMVAKATFLGALIEEMPTPLSTEVQAPPATEGAGWWRDFRKLCSDPLFGRPWNPHLDPEPEGGGPVSGGLDPAQTAV